ncbi:MAG: hypothetical protein ACWA5R_11220, partial [bacterium]
MKKVILHIGTPKTGTSSIQRWLYQHSETLLELGILYPRTGRQGVAHHLIARVIQANDANKLSSLQQADPPHEYRTSRERSILNSLEVHDEQEK